MRQAFARRRQVMLEGIAVIPKFSCPKPQGAFYLFVDISATGYSSLDFCNILLDDQHVAAVPGIAFGDDRCIRLSYATDITSIEKGMERMAKFARG